jgi:hypothetical protein
MSNTFRKPLLYDSAHLHHPLLPNLTQHKMKQILKKIENLELKIDFRKMGFDF